MAGISLQAVQKQFDKTQVINDVALDVKDGEFAVFVGPSGCGKSTLLRLIAGLEAVSDGTIRFDDQNVTDLPPAERGVAMVFQSYALYPHMSVYENMAFGLKLAKKDKTSIRDRVMEAASILQLEHLLDRKPKALSGGQRQRVAIGRAIVRQPRVFLFDEPLSNLDAALRVQMRVELKHLHRKLGTTMIYVTHDQVEAMTLADRIVVLNEGRVEQVGTPLELYRQPRNQFVAGFIGSPKMNFLSAKVSDLTEQSAKLKIGNRIALNTPLQEQYNLQKNQPVIVGLRPEHLHHRDDTVQKDEAQKQSNTITGRVVDIEHLGSEAFIHLDINTEAPLIIKSNTDRVFNLDETVSVSVPDNAFHLFTSEGTAIGL